MASWTILSAVVALAVIVVSILYLALSWDSVPRVECFLFYCQATDPVQLAYAVADVWNEIIPSLCIGVTILPSPDYLPRNPAGNLFGDERSSVLPIEFPGGQIYCAGVDLQLAYDGEQAMLSYLQSSGVWRQTNPDWILERERTNVARRFP